MTAAQQQQEGIEYLLRNIDNMYEHIENMPNRLSMMSNPNAPQRPEDIGTFLSGLQKVLGSLRICSPNPGSTRHLINFIYEMHPGF